MNRRKVGTEFEDKAIAYLEGHGMQIQERNFRCRQGEIDIIGRHEGYLVFVEVKYRSSISKGTPEEAVDYRKQRRICRTGEYYCYQRRIEENVPIRYDVIAVLETDITWYQNAFDHVY